MDFWSTWHSFWEALGRFWEASGRLFGGFGKTFGRNLGSLGDLEAYWADFGVSRVFLGISWAMLGFFGMVSGRILRSRRAQRVTGLGNLKQAILRWRFCEKEGNWCSRCEFED